MMMVVGMLEGKSNEFMNSVLTCSLQHEPKWAADSPRRAADSPRRSFFVSNVKSAQRTIGGRRAQLRVGEFEEPVDGRVLAV